MRLVTYVYFMLCSIVNGQAKKNVLFLVADDMRPQIGAYDGSDFPSPISPKMHTPNLDKLASKSLLLKRAYVQLALCAPSRTSFLTGRRPDTTHIYDLFTYWRKSGGNFTTLPQYFKQNGYHTVSLGKIFHTGSSSGYDDPISWSEPTWHAPSNRSFWDSLGREHSWFPVSSSMKAEHGLLPDEQAAKYAIETLRRLKNDVTTTGQPFFLAVGFRKPHLPFIAPQEFFDLYPYSDIRLPDNGYAPWYMPNIAWSRNTEISHNYRDLVSLNVDDKINSTRPDSVVLSLRRAYYAATSFTDNLIGRVLDELDTLGLSDNTVVSFLGDHGFHLGEHAEWCKWTNFEIATHAPLMIHAPGITDKGIITDALIEFVDVFPTLVDLAGLPQIRICPVNSSIIEVCTEGLSMVPLMENPNRQWKPRVFSQIPRGGGVFMGYSMRTNRYRYAEWVRFSGTTKFGPPTYLPNWLVKRGVELYDHYWDPEENINQAYNPDFEPLVKELSDNLHKGWRNAFPPTSGLERSFPDSS